MDLKDLYQELSLDHGKNPRNLGKFENFNKDAKGHNPLCGDKVHVYLKMDENKKISDIKFEGHGCAISMASASIMTELMKNKEEVEVKELIDDFLKMIKDSPELKSKIISDDDKIKLMSLSGVKKYPMRVKCATLPWHTLVSAMTNKLEEVNTEKED
jgi:nitrogen fixation NifU-like protein